MNRPLIGIEVDLEANAEGRRYAKCYEAYFEAVLDAGGAPILLPPTPSGVLRAVLARADGVVVPGGDDFSAEEWGEEQRPCERYVPVDGGRLAHGRRLLDEILRRRQPFLGVCYGAQLLNLVLGGSLIQDLPEDLPEQSVAHDQEHGISIAKGTLLEALVGDQEVRVNSRHHQAVRACGRGLRVSAQARDGVIEAIEGRDPEHFLIGVQWHPEELGRAPTGLALFEGLVEAARRQAALT